MNGYTTVHGYRVRFPTQDAGAGPPVPVQVHAAVDAAHQLVTVTLPDQTRATFDVVTARALQKVLSAAVYGSLRPTGPFLALERNVGDGWLTVSDGQGRR